MIVAGMLLLSPVMSSAASAQATFTATGSVGQVDVTGLVPYATASLLDSSGATVQTQVADSLGGLLFRGVAPGTGYQVKWARDGSESGPVTVYSNAAAPWDPSIYSQSIPDSGYGYLTTRDGTQLAIDVRPPLTAGAKPPYPTLIEYSGYGYADPTQPQHGMALVAQVLGFAVVDVNIRGTGCSGGAFDAADQTLQDLDGYDVVETIAHQPWVLDNKVGLFGISYGGDTQLPIAALDPPDLEAIAPLSVTAALGTNTRVGGIFNTGFSIPMAKALQGDAAPAGPSSGESYAYQRIQGGDLTCKANQALHSEATNVLSTMTGNPYYIPQDDELDPATFVNKITVPTFLACQWEDELAGGFCPDLVQHFTGTNQAWFTFTNGPHADSVDPYTFDRWYDFLELFVAHQAPSVEASVLRAGAPLMYQLVLGISGVKLPPDPIQSMSYASALAAFEALPEVRVLFDNGAGPTPAGTLVPGDPYPAFEQSFSSLPVPGTVAGYWYLGAGGTLTDSPPSASGVDSYVSNPSALPLTDYAPFNHAIWGNAAGWSWNWQQYPAGSAVSYVSAPLAANTTVIGSGAVDLWVQSSTPDVDFQATISEVRPDGTEVFVQNGWLRASERKLSTTSANMLAQPSTTLEPIPSYTSADSSPMPSGQFVEVDIPLFYEGHVYRAGSRIRVTIAAPNGTQPTWSFSQTQPSSGTATESIAFSPSMPSSVILPVVPGVAVPTGYPPCPSLRNEPCRPYVPYVNNGS
jgi:predicted acyl esterase